MNIKGSRIVLFLLLCTLIACQNEKINYVASIEGEYEITKQELVQHHKSGYFAQRFPDSEYRGYREALDELITKKLKQVDFINQGLHRNQDLISNIQKVISEELIVRYFDSEYLGQYITDEVIEDYYQGLGRRVRYQQIVLNKNNADNLESLKQKATEIKEQAENNDNFAELVNEFSEDLKSAQRDGNMSEMSWREGTSSPKNQVIFRMPEGTVRVIETTRQILVVKVNRVNEVELRPLEELKPEIFRILREVYSPRAFADYDRDKANLLDDKKYQWNEEGLNQLVEWTRIDGFYSQDKYKQIIEEALTGGNNFEILKYEKGTVDLQKYLYLLNNILLINTSANATKDDFKQFIDEALRTELIVEKARDLGFDEEILSLNTKSPVILDEYVRLYDEEFIFSKIPEKNNQNYQKFYDLTKDSLFYQPDKVNLRVKIFDSEEDARGVMAEIKNGKEFEDIFNAWSVKTYIVNKEGKIESYLSPEPNYFGDEAFKLTQGETAGPVKFKEEGETKFAVIKAHNVEEEKIRTLDEVHQRILSRMYNNYYFNKYSNEVAASLRQKYSVKINEQALVELSASNQQ